ncbi:MAG TPA: hypothetical protein VK063_01060 [Beutenbergiaceae bacterium]|nr:hypothetical protein [Beutenbergiaceae bacterium]
MRVVVQYRRGQVPADHAEANERALWAWVERLRARPEHEQTVALSGGRTVSSSGTSEYGGDVFGISVLQVPHATAAEDLLGDWPELPYGGRADILAELP